MIQEHVAAIRALYEAQGVHVHEDPPSDPEHLPPSAFPYVVLYVQTPAGEFERVCGRRSAQTLRWQTTAVALDSDGIRWVQEKLCDTEGVRPVIAERSCHPIEHPSSQAARTDMQLPDRVLMVATDQWSLTSRPATEPANPWG